MARKCRVGFFVNPANGYPRKTSDKTITKNTIRNKIYCILEYLKLSLLNIFFITPEISIS